MLPLTNWSQYLGMAAAPGQITNPGEADQFMAALHQYDPNARWNAVASGGGEGGSGGESLNQLVYDNSKLPLNVTGQPGLIGIARGTPGSGERLVNPNAVQQDPIYGPVTNWRNLQEKGPSMVDVLGPLLVGGFAGALGGFGMLGSIMSKLPNVAQIGAGMLNQGAGAAPVPMGNVAPENGVQSLQQLTPQQLMMLRLIRQQGGGT
jgi:hypothetical protein